MGPDISTKQPLLLEQLKYKLISLQAKGQRQLNISR